MKTLLPTFLAVLVAAGLALFVYDRFVLAPRLEKAGEAAHVSLTEARQQANQIASDLDASVDRSVAGARSAFDELAQAEDARRDDLEQQAQEMRRTAQAADALMRASVMKVAIAEYYMEMGQWPANATDIGFGEAKDFAGGPVASMAIEPEGVIAISLRADVAPGARLRLVPRASTTGMIEWTCRASDYAAAERLAACKP